MPSSSPVHAELVELRQEAHILSENSRLNEECPICLEEFGSSGSISLGSCRHGYHPLCMEKWMEHCCAECRNPTPCPICGQHFSSGRMGPVVEVPIARPLPSPFPTDLRQQLEGIAAAHALRTRTREQNQSCCTKERLSVIWVFLSFSLLLGFATMVTSRIL